MRRGSEAYLKLGEGKAGCLRVRKKIEEGEAEYRDKTGKSVIEMTTSVSKVSWASPLLGSLAASQG